MPSFTVFKCVKDGYPKKTTTTKADALSGDQVFIKVTASGVCGTDLHYQHADILLHEGIGVVEEFGPDVKVLKKGDRNALCTAWRTCTKAAAYNAVLREAFLFKIPDNISDEHAAPLQCGGATVFTALSDIKPYERVGIMVVGGLGHLAIRFAHSMGARVFVLSGSESKKEEAMKLGANYFIATQGKKELDLQIAPKLNRLLVTMAVPPDWNIIFPIMAPGSCIYPLTVSGENLSIPTMQLITTGVSVVGSMVATQILEFASFHKITPVIEKFPMSEDGIKEAIQKLEHGDVHFRAVLIPPQ